MTVLGYELYREVLNHAPDGLDPAGLLLLLVVADDANDRSRLSYATRDQLVLWLRMDHWRSIQKIFTRLAEAGVEVRVAFAKDKHGRPVFATRGNRTVYRIPEFAPAAGKEDSTVPLSERKGAPQGTLSDARKGAPQGRKGAPQGPSPAPAGTPSPHPSRVRGPRARKRTREAPSPPPRAHSADAPRDTAVADERQDAPPLEYCPRKHPRTRLESGRCPHGDWPEALEASEPETRRRPWCGACDRWKRTDGDGRPCAACGSGAAP